MESSATLCALSHHPLCDCVLQEVPPPDWRHLARIPVLKRHVLTEFRTVAMEMAKIPQTPRKRKRIARQSGNLYEYKALCLASLCQKLAQCELLSVGEAELVKAVVNLESIDVLQRVINSNLLPLRPRMLLFATAMQEQGLKCLEPVVQCWIQTVSEKMLEEVLDATTMSGSSEPPAKRTKTKSSETIQKNQWKLRCCDFCQGKASIATLRSRLKEWKYLVESSQQTARILESNGYEYCSNKAMIALSAFWDPLSVAGLTTTGKAVMKRKRSDLILKNVEAVVPSMLVVDYKQILQNIMAERFGCVGGEADVLVKVWTSVWKREVKNVFKTKQITLNDAIRQCSIADAYAGAAVFSEFSDKITHLPGFCIVMEVIRFTCASISGVIAAFAHAWTETYSNFGLFVPEIEALGRRGISSTKPILRSYLSKVLLSTEVQFLVGPSAQNELLFVLYEIFFEQVYVGKQNSSFFKYWDALMSQLDSSSSVTKCGQEGKNWCLFLEKCVFCVDARGDTTMRSRYHFLQALKAYCLAIMQSILTSGGRIISSGGAIQRPLIVKNSDRATVCQVLAQMMAKFGEEWVSCLIAQLLRASASLRSVGESNEQGITNLFFPGLVSAMKSTSKKSNQKTGKQLFIDVIHLVNNILKESEPTILYLVALMRFCEAWDAYQCTNTKVTPARAKRWGFQAVLDLNILPELLQCYEKADVVLQETSNALLFVADVLQSMPTCPPTLEESLHKVLSHLRASVEHEPKSIFNSEDAQLVSHSNIALHRLICAVKCVDFAQTRKFLTRLKGASGTLNEFRQQLERWFLFVENYGATFAGKEMRLELSFLCTRLIRWFPDEFGSIRSVFMTPLHSHFILALKAFVKEAARIINVEDPSMNSTLVPSAVRIEMALHLYLSAAGLPDLETLTILLTKAIVKCRSPDAFYCLAKIAQKNNRMLLTEAVVATLSFPLRGLEFSCFAFIRHDVDSVNDTQLQIHTRRMKAFIYQENTLKLLAGSASIFDGGISLSVLIFDEKAAATWLPYFFEHIYKTDFCGGAQCVDQLLTMLEELMRQNDVGQLREAYWFAALLNTALIACSSRCAGADVDVNIHERLRLITSKVLQTLSIVSLPALTQESDTFSQLNKEALGLMHSTQCARLSIDEHRASWTCIRQMSEKSSSAVQLCVSDIWNARIKKLELAGNRPSLQLFLPFTLWLSGALIYSQSFLEEPSTDMRRWEHAFTSYVTDVYLHIEFEGVTCNLLQSWLITWITCNISRGQNELLMLALLPSQVTLFRRLGLTSSRSSQQDQASTSLWLLIFKAIDLALNGDTANNSTFFEQATELVLSTLITLELAELSAISDFSHFENVQDVEPLFKELESIFSRPYLCDCNATSLWSLLQYLLEVIVCCFTCKISKDSDSQLFLQRTKSVLELSKVINKPASCIEANTYFQHWTAEMLLKYDYVDRNRCINVLEVIERALYE